MTTRRPGVRRAFQPAPEGLEDRQLLAKVVTGVDPAGDIWTLRLIGAGDLRVTNQPDATGNPVPLGQPAWIQDITLAGVSPTASKLLGMVKKAPGSDGRVFFQNLTVQGSTTSGASGIYGIHDIDMPDFWLGYTSAAAPPPAPGSSSQVGSINIPEGVTTLRFGGVDATFTPQGGTPLNQSGQDNYFNVNLGLPRFGGTSIVVDKVITTAEATPTATHFDGAYFDVDGRINLFQANAIIDNSGIPSSGAAFSSSLFGTGPFGGGTVLVSLPQNTPLNIVGPSGLGQVVDGQIGFVHIGGDATNFSVQTNTTITNYFVGGETDNIFITAIGGLRFGYFGQGLDTATIRADQIVALQANRGAVGSDIVVNNFLGQALFGGDVIDTNILAGYQQDLVGLERTQSGFDLVTPPPAQLFGNIKNLLIAGNVENSIFAASVDPINPSDVSPIGADVAIFGPPDQLTSPTGKIKAKIQGTIDNTGLMQDPSTPVPPMQTHTLLIQPGLATQAFFAQNIELSRGPVTPPRVAQPPYPNAGAAPRGPRLARHLQPSDPNLRQLLARRLF